ncbi:hypothetical protein Tco_1325808 [Tanacetum coccineum]
MTLWPLRLTLPNKLDWNNPKGDRYPFDLSKPLPLQGHPGHLTVAVDYFFNNDLEYLKSSDPERTYTMSITKTKAAQYEIEWIEDMIMVKRADHQFYKFKEGDFVDLHLNDIKDMLLLVVQHKLFHLTDNDIADELYKFSDKTLKKVRDELHHRIRDFRLEYNKEMPRRK